MRQYFGIIEELLNRAAGGTMSEGAAVGDAATGEPPLPPRNPAEHHALLEKLLLAAGSEFPSSDAGELSQRDHFPAAEAAEICAQAWRALSRGEPSLNRLARCQQPSGALLAARSSDSPELVWYHELVLLHALTTFAICRNDPESLAAVNKAALFHLQETQPDHASTRPWALHAFLLDPQTYPLADTMLDTVLKQLAQNPDRVTLLLLGDALYCGNVYRAAQPD